MHVSTADEIEYTHACAAIV